MEPQILPAGRPAEEVVFPCSAEVDPRTGAAVVQAPLPLSPGRAAFTPELTLAYDSRGPNSAFGLGWSLSGAAPITVSTTEALPEYRGSDRFASPSGDDLVP